MHISTEVFYRDNMGRFIADCMAAATKVVSEGLDDGIEAARGAAPVKTGFLRSSFEKQILSRTSGIFFNSAHYAIWQDQGGDPHQQTGWVSFLWEREGRMWEPGANLINHPGNPATHFMDVGYRAACRGAMAAAPPAYPG